MARDPEQIAKDFLDQFLDEQGYNSTIFYQTMQALDRDSDLDDVRPEIEANQDKETGIEIRIRADYSGDRQLTPDQTGAQTLFDNLSRRTEITFENLRHIKSEELRLQYYVADVSMVAKSAKDGIMSVEIYCP